MQGRYEVKSKTGEIDRYNVCLGTDTVTDEDVTIKLECLPAADSALERDAWLHQVLLGGVGIPSLHWCGVDNGSYILVSDRLGPSLKDLRGFYKGRFPLKTVIILAEQLLTRLEFVHSKSYIHGALSPENIFIGTGKSRNQFHLTNFGRAQRYRDSEGRHVLNRQDQSFADTSEFASRRSHSGFARSRCDDLESLGYVLLLFCRGCLPWQSSAETHPEPDRAHFKKENMTTEMLCQDVPDEFNVYFDHVLNLGFEERPRYQFLRNLFAGLFRRLDPQLDFVLDWAGCEAAKCSASSSVAPFDEEGFLTQHYRTPLTTDEITAKVEGLDMVSCRHSNWLTIVQALAVTSVSSRKVVD